MSLCCLQRRLQLFPHQSVQRDPHNRPHFRYTHLKTPALQQKAKFLKRLPFTRLASLNRRLQRHGLRVLVYTVSMTASLRVNYRVNSPSASSLIRQFPTGSLLLACQSQVGQTLLVSLFRGRDCHPPPRFLFLASV
eukprot:m.167576 g.167576  ORF g.167576 m.167576 type:complete len:136 (+) comp53173_c0_seq6:249-656(+)